MKYFWLHQTSKKMNRDLITLFNNGNNNSTIKIISEEGEKIGCHDFVFETQCSFGVAFTHFESSKRNNDTNDIEVNLSTYPSKIIKQLFSKMYSSDYVFSDLNPHEIISMTKLADELVVKNKSDILSELLLLFKKQLANDNWLQLLNDIFNVDIFGGLQNCLVDYFINEILPKDFDQFPDIGETPEEVKNFLLNIFEKNKKVSKLLTREPIKNWNGYNNQNIIYKNLNNYSNRNIIYF